MAKKILTAEEQETVAAIVREDLMERYAGEFVFDPILVDMAVDHCGDEYLRIRAIYSGQGGQGERLDPGWNIGIIRRIRPKLEAAGLPYFPDPGFIEKSEWKPWPPVRRK